MTSLKNIENTVQRKVIQEELKVVNLGTNNLKK